MPLVRPLFGERPMLVGFGIQMGTSVATIQRDRPRANGPKQPWFRQRGDEGTAFPELSRPKKTPPVFYQLTGHLELSLWGIYPSKVTCSIQPTRSPRYRSVIFEKKRSCLLAAHEPTRLAPGPRASTDSI